MDRFLNFVVEVMAASGGLALLVMTLGGKFFNLAYDTLKQKLTSNIEKSQLEFAHNLDERLKYVEDNIARALHAAMTQYDIEIKKYDEILKVLYTSSLDVKNLYQGCFIDDKDERDRKMREVRENALKNAEACMKSCEESASFIRLEVCDAMRQYVHCVQELESIHRQCKYGIEKDCSPEVQERAERLKAEIEHEKKVIQDAIRTRLDQFESVERVS